MKTASISVAQQRCGGTVPGAIAFRATGSYMVAVFAAVAGAHRPNPMNSSDLRDPKKIFKIIFPLLKSVKATVDSASVQNALLLEGRQRKQADLECRRKLAMKRSMTQCR